MSSSRAEKTRERILESGMDVLLGEEATSVSLRQVASAAGITPMAIYRHFDDKEALELALLDHAFGVFESYLAETAATGSASDRLDALAGRFFDFALEREAHFRFLFFSSVRPASGGRGSEVRSISRPTFLLLKNALGDWSDERSADIEDLNQLTIDVLACCVGQVALVVSGNLNYPTRQKKRRYMEAFRRLLADMGSD